MVQRNAFTLSEVLIALALLGVIAAFTIPKVLMSAANEERTLKMKEAMAILSDISYQGSLDGQLNANTFTDYFLSRLNCLKSCPTNSADDGCWNEAVQGVSNQTPEPGCLLPNGLVITGINSSPLPLDFGCNGIQIDHNGKGLPNKVGEDQLVVSLRISSAPNFCDASQKIGSLTVNNVIDTQVTTWYGASAVTPNRQLFDEITGR